MSLWNFDALAEKATSSLSDWLTYKEGVKTTKELQPLLVETWQKTFIPVLVIVLAFFLLRKIRW
jgi:lipopolysaccharide export LptBFGC system permease protein LptF